MTDDCIGSCVININDIIAHGQGGKSVNVGQVSIMDTVL